MSRTSARGARHPDGRAAHNWHRSINRAVASPSGPALPRRYRPWAPFSHDISESPLVGGRPTTFARTRRRRVHWRRRHRMGQPRSVERSDRRPTSRPPRPVFAILRRCLLRLITGTHRRRRLGRHIPPTQVQVNRPGARCGPADVTWPFGRSHRPLLGCVRSMRRAFEICLASRFLHPCAPVERNPSPSGCPRAESAEI